jgi:hypothetical protein
VEVQEQEQQVLTLLAVHVNQLLHLVEVSIDVMLEAVEVIDKVRKPLQVVVVTVVEEQLMDQVFLMKDHIHQLQPIQPNRILVLEEDKKVVAEVEAKLSLELIEVRHKCLPKGFDNT